MSIRPQHPRADAPNHGLWFVVDARPGVEVAETALVANPGPTSQRVRLYLADLTFGANGSPTVADQATEVGAWGRFDEADVVVPAGGEVAARFTIRVPAGTDPGDHVGAVVAESAPEGVGALRVVKRVAARVYVTVPGVVRAAAQITAVRVVRDRSVAPRWATVTVDVRNTGTVRLAASVKVGGARARGSALVMSRSVERYVIRRSLPVWGGPVSWPVEVDTRTPLAAGPSLTMTASTFVFPWVLLLVLLLLLVGGGTLWQLRKRRDRRLEDLVGQVERLEQRLRSAGEPRRPDGPRRKREAPLEAPDRAAPKVDERARAPR